MAHGDFGHGRGRGIQDVLNRRDPGDGLLGKDAELQGERSGKFAIEINRTAAHAGNDAGMLDFGALELNKNDGLLGPEEIFQHSNDFEVEFFDLVTGEDGIGIALHTGLNLAKGKGFGSLLRTKIAGDRNQTNPHEQRDKREEPRYATIHRMGPGRKHELPIIPGTRTRGNWTAGRCALVGTIS